MAGQYQNPGIPGLHSLSDLSPVKTYPVLGPSSLVSKLCVTYWKMLEIITYTVFPYSSSSFLDYEMKTGKHALLSYKDCSHPVLARGHTYEKDPKLH